VEKTCSSALTRTRIKCTPNGITNVLTRSFREMSSFFTGERGDTLYRLVVSQKQVNGGTSLQFLRTGPLNVRSPHGNLKEAIFFENYHSFKVFNGMNHDILS